MTEDPTVEADGMGWNGYCHLDDEPTTWEPVDLGPYLRGQIKPPAPPSIGLCRTDGVRLLYPGCEHTVIGETESGKTWLALACVAAELVAKSPHPLADRAVLDRGRYPDEIRGKLRSVGTRLYILCV